MHTVLKDLYNFIHKNKISGGKKLLHLVALLNCQILAVTLDKIHRTKCNEKQLIKVPDFQSELGSIMPATLISN